MEGVSDTIELEKGMGLNGIMRGRLPMRYWCHCGEHLKENCQMRAEEMKFREEKKKKGK